ncbi:hypothetical protein ABVT39_017683 [Epinephelus coioides]
MLDDVHSFQHEPECSISVVTAAETPERPGVDDDDDDVQLHEAQSCYNQSGCV